MTNPASNIRPQYQNARNLNARIAIHANYSTNTYGWQQWIFDHIELPDTARILELGCGPAGLWTTNRHRIPVGWRLVLTDFSPGMVATAQGNLAPQRQVSAYAVVDALSAPFEDRAFSGVIANHMLYHVPCRNQIKTFVPIGCRAEVAVKYLKPGLATDMNGHRIEFHTFKSPSQGVHGPHEFAVPAPDVQGPAARQEADGFAVPEYRHNRCHQPENKGCPYVFVAVLVSQHTEFHGTVMFDMADFPVNGIIFRIESAYFPGCRHGILINSGASAALHVLICLGPVKKQIPAPVRKVSGGITERTAGYVAGRR